MELNRVRRGVFWSFVEKFSFQGTHFLITLIITRYVLPSEYGLIAMLGIFLAVSQSLVDSGFSNALIQKQDRESKDFSTVFVFNIVLSLILYFILFLSAPYIAAFYDEPELTIVTRVVAFCIIFNAFSIIQKTKYTIDLDYKSISKASLISVIVSGVIAVYMAYIGMGVWAIVFQMLCSAFINTIILWILSSWRPQMDFSWLAFRQMFGFGSKILISGLMHTIYMNLYTLVIGKFYSSTDTGYYNRASSLAQFPSTNISQVFGRVFFPSLCEKQHDKDLFSTIFHSYLCKACFVIFPLSVGMTILAEPFIRLVLSDKWDGAIIPVQILSIAFMFYPIMYLNNLPLQAFRQGGMFLKAEIIKKVIAIIILVTSLSYGLYVLCFGILVYNVFDSCLIISFGKRLFPTGYMRQMRLLSPLFISSLMMGVLLWLLVYYSGLGDFLVLLIGVIVGPFIYLIFNVILKNKETIELFNIIKNVRSNNCNTCL